MTAFAMALLLLGIPEPDPVCYARDVQTYCCPSACAARRDSSKWPQADAILRGCMSGLGCKETGATVAGRCNCR